MGFETRSPLKPYIRKARECVNIFGGRNLARGPKVVKKKLRTIVAFGNLSQFMPFQGSDAGCQIWTRKLLESCQTHIFKKVPGNNLRGKNAVLGAIF